MRHGVKGQIVTVYRVGHWQRYGVTVRGDGTGVYTPLERYVAVVKTGNAEKS
jgi:hypothetical protein